MLLHVEMALQDRATIEAFEAEITRIDEVAQCRRMFGRPDYLIWIATADLDAYERLYMAKLTSLPGVARTNSQFTMKTVKPSVAVHEVCLASAADRLVGEVGRCGFVLDVSADGACVIAAVKAADKP